MTWANTLLPATYGGIEFHIIKTDDTADRTLVEHSYPFIDGADVEDMGRGSRKISVEAIFYGDYYELQLNDFLKALDSASTTYPDKMLQHPVFGEIMVRVARYAVHHDADNIDQAAVTVDFVESTPGNPFFDSNQISTYFKALSERSAFAQDVAIGKFAALVDKIQTANPLAGLQQLRQAITGPLLYSMSFSNAVLANLDVLAYPRSWANDFSALINGALDIHQWGEQLESDWSSIKATFSSLDVFSTPSGAQPAQADSTAAIVPSEAQVVAATQVTVDVFQALALANASALAFSAISSAQTTSSTASPQISPDAIEEIANSVREAIQSTITHAALVYTLEDGRAITEALKEVAFAVQSAAAALIEARPPLMQRRITTPGNMRLVAHHLYGDHTRSTELYRFNGARSPFVEVGDVLNAYAD